MAEIRISRVLAIPAVLAPSTIYVTPSSDINLAEIAFTNMDGTAIRHVLNKADVAAMITTAVSGLSGGGSSTAQRLETARLINGVAFDGTQDIVINAVDATPRIAVSEKGMPNGVSTLDANGLVPANQLPSYVDDVIEVANQAALPATGESGKIYVTADSSKIFRWTGTVYFEIQVTAGASDTATRLAQARAIQTTGDVVWSVVFDGTADVSSAATLSNTGVAAGSYPVVTVDAKGRVTAGRALTAADIPVLDHTKVLSAQSLFMAGAEW